MNPIDEIKKLQNDIAVAKGKQEQMRIHLEEIKQKAKEDYKTDDLDELKQKFENFKNMKKVKLDDWNKKKQIFLNLVKRNI